eukprot:5017930-Pleurochrysis_carterae.AAC.1
MLSESGEAAGEPRETAGEPGEAAGETREAAGEPGRDIFNTLEINERVFERVFSPPSAAEKLRVFRTAVVQFCGSGRKGGSGSR